MAQLQFNGDLLRQRREERGLYLKDVAAAVGYSAAAVGQWETGKRNPSATAAKKLADFFGVDSAAFWIDPTVPVHDFTIKTQGDLLRVIRALADIGTITGVSPEGALTLTYTPKGKKFDAEVKMFAGLLEASRAGWNVPDGFPQTWEPVIDFFMEKTLPELDKIPLTGAEPPAGEE